MISARPTSAQRNSCRITRLGIFAAAALALVVFGIGFVMFDSGARELLLNDRPEARADAYLSAVRRG